MATYPAVNVAAVDCQKQVRSWQFFRSLIEFLIPTCNCAFSEEEPTYSSKPTFPSTSSSATSVTGTIFGYRRGKVNFCIQTHSKSTNPILLLELAVPTAILAREMRGGVLRIALESTSTAAAAVNSGGRSVLSSPAWSMYFNGRKVGYALRRRASAADVETLRRLGTMVEGAGIMGGKEVEGEGEGEGEDDYLMYLRGNFDRVCGASGDSESFHLRDPNGSIGQELSIFFFRST
ncbi:protein MIZU-KUSSEI 1-like [Cucurbita maxima]|uniref:Protein MIZU-KUSSEI 1-like n=1 Tax=Cucurbita maxima TaxID=3661 RepID=A0A6J1ITF7_CUCMA|nr:protein MIZU-KUSSEI 1-like [Cucurbita maxima]